MGMNRVKIPVPARKHVILAKLGGGAMWFWVLWRLKHDWRTLYGHYNPADASVSRVVMTIQSSPVMLQTPQHPEPHGPSTKFRQNHMLPGRNRDFHSVHPH